ncbi:hypothetical protein [Haladaptatus salinisoli]|uniref:hypothetical protein n=1 Tax=Haladaptatus salinisoli TaxID=2884876 RepID=UPI001D0A94FF|nr:hypothetical protein [Haladaptatus salinisoli]
MIYPLAPEIGGDDGERNDGADAIRRTMFGERQTPRRPAHPTAATVETFFTRTARGKDGMFAATTAGGRFWPTTAH